MNIVAALLAIVVLKPLRDARVATSRDAREDRGRRRGRDRRICRRVARRGG